jgi:hypothetical protein
MRIAAEPITYDQPMLSLCTTSSQEKKIQMKMQTLRYERKLNAQNNLVQLLRIPHCQLSDATDPRPLESP